MENDDVKYTVEVTPNGWTETLVFRGSDGQLHTAKRSWDRKEPGRFNGTTKGWEDVLNAECDDYLYCEITEAIESSPVSDIADLLADM